MCSLNRMPGLALATEARACGLCGPQADHAADDDAEAVVLDLVQPLAAGRQLICFGRKARCDEIARIGISLEHFEREPRLRG